MTHEEGICYDFLAFLGKTDRLKLPVDEAAKVVKDFFADPKYRPKPAINRISAKDFSPIDNAASKFADAVTSTQDLAQEIVSVCMSRLDYVYSDLVLAIDDLKQKSGVKD